MSIFCFLINIYNESKDQIYNIVRDLNISYENPTIILLYDGVLAYKIDNCLEIEGEKLKYPYPDGRWTHRYLEKFILYSNSDYLIKLDPDCSITKKYSIETEFNGIFGYFNLLGISKWKYILQGGRYGIHRTAVKTILDSNLLLSDFSKYNNIQDIMMTDVLHKLNIPYKIDLHFMDCFFHKNRGSEECKIPKSLNRLL